MCGQNANLLWLFSSIKACEGVCVCVKDCSRVWGHQGQDHYNCFQKITFNCRERTPSRCTFCLLCLSYCGLFGSPGRCLCLKDKRSKHKWGNDKQTLSSFSGRCERMMSAGYRRETFGKKYEERSRQTCDGESKKRQTSQVTGTLWYVWETGGLYSGFGKRSASLSSFIQNNKWIELLLIFCVSQIVFLQLYSVQLRFN